MRPKASGISARLISCGLGNWLSSVVISHPLSLPASPCAKGLLAKFCISSDSGVDLPMVTKLPLCSHSGDNPLVLGRRPSGNRAAAAAFDLDLLEDLLLPLPLPLPVPLSTVPAFSSSSDSARGLVLAAAAFDLDLLEDLLLPLPLPLPVPLSTVPAFSSSSDSARGLVLVAATFDLDLLGDFDFFPRPFPRGTFPISAGLLSVPSVLHRLARISL